MIQHVTRQIEPAKLSECVDFYRLLGFEPTPVAPGLEGRAVWLAPRTDGSHTAGDPTQSVHIHLMPAAGAPPEHGHVAFVLEDYDGTLTRLRAAGFEVEPRREHWDSPRSYVRDPASNLVELMAFAPPTGAPGAPGAGVPSPQA